MCNELKSTVGNTLWIFTVPFPITLTVLSPTVTSTILIPEFCISSATSAVITSPAWTKTSPVSASIISFADICPVILVAKLNFWLNL